jgi:hypothetical protein
VVDLVLVAVFGSQLRSFSTSVFGNGDKETLASILFIEGGLALGAGAVYFSGMGENVGGTHPVVLDKRLEQRREMREQQKSSGVILMLIGGPLILLSLLIYLIM